MRFADLVHDRTRKVPFLIRPDILDSDEAIVAVFTHEVHELRSIRTMLKKGRMTIEDFGLHTAPGIPGNLHDQAWDLADAAVLKMRGPTE